MVEDNFNSEKESDKESELYALIHTILNAYEKFQEGSINDNNLSDVLGQQPLKLLALCGANHVGDVCSIEC